MANTVLIKFDDIQAVTEGLFLKVGMSAEDAKFQADALLTSNLWGIDSHGALRIPDYLNRYENGALNATPDIKVVRGEGSVVVVDGDAGSGFVVGKKAMEMAIEKAKEYGIAAVGVINSNHFGAGAIYTRMAAEAGMVGICMTNVKPLMAAPGASKAVIGNNPIAFAIPTYGEFPFVLDMSLSKVAGGKLKLAMEKGEKIPSDWATDKDGRPTDDPAKGFNGGYLLPVGDFKGLGLAYMADILCGLITGGVFADKMKSMYKEPADPSLTGHFMIVINIENIISKEDMKAKMAEYLKYLKSIPMWQENGELYLPGELEYNKSIERLRDGLPIPNATVDKLVDFGKKLGLAPELIDRLAKYQK